MENAAQTAPVIKYRNTINLLMLLLETTIFYLDLLRLLYALIA